MASFKNVLSFLELFKILVSLGSVLIFHFQFLEADSLKPLFCGVVFKRPLNFSYNVNQLFTITTFKFLEEIRFKIYNAGILKFMF